MDYYFELIHKEDNLPVKAFLHSVNEFETHWHNELEILVCLEGSVTVSIGKDIYLIKKGEFIIINKNEPHSIRKTDEDNVLLGVQIDSLYISKIYPDFHNMYFKAKNTSEDTDIEGNMIIKRSLSKILVETTKKTPGYEFRVSSEVNLLASYLVEFYDHKILENGSLDQSDKNRMKRIVDYININAYRQITLTEIADKEELTIHHLSRIFKENIGVNFHEYLVNLRLLKAKELLLTTDLSITDISYKSGFPSTKSLNRYFKKEYNDTPSNYKNAMRGKNKENLNLSNTTKKNIEQKNKMKSYLDIDRSAFLENIFESTDDTNLSQSIKNQFVTETSKKVEISSLEIDLLGKGEELNPYWENLITLPRAHDVLKSSIKDELASFKEGMKFNNIRFHGIFSDEMMVVNFNENEDIVYNWTYVDEVFDYLLSVGIKPFVELGFMPNEIKLSSETIFHWKANISMPKDIKLWNNLIREFINHLINRYGIKEIRTWYFEVWNQPELEGLFWVGTKEDYFEFYKNTYLTIKSIDENIKVGGPSVTHESIYEFSWIGYFLDYLKKEKLKVDFITIHIYPERFTSQKDIENVMKKLKEGKDESYILTSWTEIEKIYHGKDHLKNTIRNLKELSTEKLGFFPEVHVTEWNASAFVRNYIHDTCFVSNFILYNVIQNINTIDSLGYWTLTDLIEEHKIGISHFHGGFGLINKDGIKKPSYFAYYFLSKLGPIIISKGENYIVTKDKENNEIQIIIFNYTYFNDLFMQGETSFLTSENRYEVYEYKDDILFDLTLKNLKGNYKISKYNLDRENGSAFDEWKNMGMPENMSKEEVNYLKYKSIPSLLVSNEYIEDELNLKETISPHGSMLITLKKQYN